MEVRPNVAVKIRHLLRQVPLGHVVVIEYRTQGTGLSGTHDTQKGEAMTPCTGFGGLGMAVLSRCSYAAAPAQKQDSDPRGQRLILQQEADQAAPVLAQTSPNKTLIQT